MIYPEDIGNWLYGKLTTDSAVAAIISTKVFPLVTKEPQNLPWIVYDNIIVVYEKTKDKSIASSATLTIVCATDSYDNGNVLTKAVDQAINMKDGCSIDQITSSYDDVVGFINEINITIEL